ncbi:hypothetical protein RHSIM_Rhsim09G0147800 [Rhododendron simsii]|uniref:Uncharacterized protein n=1 Tax=Rhododendron simsii TaxID=118357 RepID=A0A834GL14_RHOSS|nr:hypothetical protein RHSIM_Rhsim09G0147800 [Rhododendron simsii]
MASSLVTFESVSFACSHIRPIFSLLSNPFVVSTFSSPKTANYIKLKHLARASSSSEGLPTELIEDSKFVPLTAEDPQYGPPWRRQQRLEQKGWTPCYSESSLLSVSSSVEKDSFWFSALIFIYGFGLITRCYAGLEPAVFAALFPNSADKPLQELLEEIMGDHEMLIFYLDSLQSDWARHCQMQNRDLEDQELNDRSRYCLYVPVVLA